MNAGNLLRSKFVGLEAEVTAKHRTSQRRPMTGVILVLLFSSLAGSGCDRPDVIPSDERVTRFAVRDEGGFRHRLVVDGIVLRGEVSVVDRGESTFVDGHLWLPRRPSPRHTGYGPLDREDSLRMLRIPYIARRARPGEPLSPIVDEWHERRVKMGFNALRAYQAELVRSGDTTYAEALGRARFEPEIAESSRRDEHPPRFRWNNVTFYSPGYGWEEFLNMGPGSESLTTRNEPVPGAGRGPELAQRFENPRKTVVAWLGDSILILHGGPEAETAADQIDALTDPDTLRGAMRLARVVHPERGLAPTMLEMIRARHPLRRGN